VYNELYGEVEKIAAPLTTAGKNMVRGAKQFKNQLQSYTGKDIFEGIKGKFDEAEKYGEKMVENGLNKIPFKKLLTSNTVKSFSFKGDIGAQFG
jgi:hypothetical protein